MEDRKETQPLFYALKFGAVTFQSRWQPVKFGAVMFQSWWQPVNVVTLVASWTAPGPVASPALAGLSALASLFPGWCVACTRSMALASPEGRLCHWVWRWWETDVACRLSLFPSILHLDVLLSLPITTSSPTSVTMSSFILYHSRGSASLVDPRPIEPAYVRHCWALGMPMVSQGSIDLLLYRAYRLG